MFCAVMLDQPCCAISLWQLIFLFLLYCRLSGRTHQVFTGVAIAWRKGEQQTLEFFHKATDVTFAKLDSQLVEAYVQTGEPL